MAYITYWFKDLNGRMLGYVMGYDRPNNKPDMLESFNVINDTNYKPNEVRMTRDKTNGKKWS